MSTAVHDACQDYSVLVTVFSFLAGKELLSSATSVCKAWHHVAMEPVVWLRRLKIDCCLLDHEAEQLSPEAGEDWPALWRRLVYSHAHFDQDQTHPEMELFEDRTVVKKTEYSSIWRLSMVEGVIRHTDNIHHYCLFKIRSTMCSNIMFGVVTATLDAKALQDPVGCCAPADEWLMVGHSATLWHAKADVYMDGWDARHGVTIGNTVGLLMDTTLGSKGASLYYYINGEQRKVAYKGLLGSFRFAIQLYNGNSHDAIEIVKDPVLSKKPVLLDL